MHLKNILAMVLILSACRETYTPKPRAYYRIDFPEKEYQTFRSGCRFSFEYPVYGRINQVNLKSAEPCWYNIDFSDYQATIHLTYKPVQSNLSVYIEDIRRIVNKHIIKADDIILQPVHKPEKRVYGAIYDISGNTASAVNFYLTDSTTGFLSGSLYFNTRPNADSLAPAIKYFRQDIVHLIESFSWE